MGTTKHQMITPVPMQLTWHPCTSIANILGEEVLVYDHFLDDVVFGWCRNDGNGCAVWVDSQTGDTLPGPLFWAEKPYPQMVKE